MKKLFYSIIVFLVVFGIGKLPTNFERQESDVFTSVETSSTNSGGRAELARPPLHHVAKHSRRSRIIAS